MNVFDLLFGSTGQALQYIFKIGYIPVVPDDFLELTEYQYTAFVRQFGETKEKIFMLSPQKPTLMEDDYNEISCLKESEIEGFQNAARLIEDYCNKGNKVFNTTEEKLRFMAHNLPDIFSKGTKYEKYAYLSIDE